ncbi:MAG: hypothetical protein NTZ05_20125 [Chloroflexi bacterium]|nr:hypothetical protein [Chloroflexota bacterium]
MRFSVEHIIDETTVPGLHQPISLALDSQGNLLICDRYRQGPFILSRLVTADNYARVVLGSEVTLGLPPQTVRVGPGDSLYIHGRPSDGSEGTPSSAVRLSGYGRMEQTYRFPSAPFDLCVDGRGKLWAIFPEDSPVAMLHAYDLDGSLLFDYGDAVKTARRKESDTPPSFADGQAVAVAPDGSIWLGAYGPSPDEDEKGNELINCAVNLLPDGSWRSWHFPSTFDRGSAFVDFLGMAAPGHDTLLTIAYGNVAEFGESDEFLVELDCAAQQVHWHNLADDLGITDLKARLFPSIADLAFRNGRLYLCDRNQSRIIIVRVEP